MSAFPNPLREIHQRVSAEFQGYDQLEIVSTFGLPQAEYAALRRSAGLMDLPQRGVLELTGRDRLSFLNNLLTAQTWDNRSKSGLAPGAGVYAFLLNAKGRILADMNVLERGERTLLEMDIRLVETVRATLDRYLFSEQVQMSPLVGQAYRLALHGEGAGPILKEVVGDFAAESPLQSAAVRWSGEEILVFREDQCAAPGFQLILPAGRAAGLWNELLGRFAVAAEPGQRRLRPVGWAAFNACRIEAGLPLFDIDFGNSRDPDESTLPAETGPLFERAVSMTKGCYLGQEIVARMHARGQLARRLVGVRMEGDALPLAGNGVFDGSQNQVGVVTSSTLSPVLSNAAIAIAMVKRPHFEPGTALDIPAEGAMHRGMVVALPFVK